jgi:hypothetical protein
MVWLEQGARMLFHRLGLGFSPSSSNPARRHCYVRPAALDQLLESLGALELLAEELGVEPALSTLSLVEQLDAIRGRAIHLAVTHSPVRGLSIEEIIVVTAYASRRFDRSAWKRQLVRQPSQQELNQACEAWLMERSSRIFGGHCTAWAGHAGRWSESGLPIRWNLTSSRLLLPRSQIAKRSLVSSSD